MLSNTLIEKSLALCGKTTSYVSEEFEGTYNEFSIEKFCYYLLSPDFIEKYLKLDHLFTYDKYVYFMEIAEAIYEYQSGDEEPLQDLLNKIP